MAPRTTWYWVAAHTLIDTKRPPAWWVAHSLIPLVLIPAQDHLLYDGNTEAGTIEVMVRQIASFCPPGFLLTFWACNNLRRATIEEWADPVGWAIFLARLGWLAEGVRTYGGAGIICDSEIYWGALDQKTQTGPMDQSLVWLPSPFIPARAAAYAAAIGPDLLCGPMVASSEFQRFPAMTAFWRQVGKGRGRHMNLLLGEDYARGERPDYSAADRLGARYVPGFSGVQEAKAHGIGWCYQSGGGLLKKG